MVREGLIDREEAVIRQDPGALNQLLLPSFDPASTRTLISRGLPASPGAAVGMVVFTAEDAVAAKAEKKKVIMVRMA